MVNQILNGTVAFFVVIGTRVQKFIYERKHLSELNTYLLCDISYKNSYKLLSIELKYKCRLY